jgi:hypothetical protein
MKTSNLTKCLKAVTNPLHKAESKNLQILSNLWFLQPQIYSKVDSNTVYLFMCIYVMCSALFMDYSAICIKSVP